MTGSHSNMTGSHSNMTANHYNMADHISKVDYSVSTYTILGVEFILTTAVVAARVVSRRMMKASLRTDDILTYVAFVSYPRSLLG